MGIIRFLLAIIAFFRAVLCCARRRRRADASRKVVIIGAGFAGTAVARELRHDPDGDNLDVVVIEPKSFAEYVPGVLRGLIQPAHAPGLRVPLTASSGALDKVRYIQATVRSIQQAADGPPGSGYVECVDGTGRSFQQPFDVCVVASGSHYVSPIKANPEEGIISAERRQQQLEEAAAEIAASKEVLIVGGGPVGVELAGELVSAGRVLAQAEAEGATSAGAVGKCRLTVVTLAPRLLETLPESMGAAAEAWLTARGVTVVCGESLPGFSPFAPSTPRPLPNASTSSAAAAAAKNTSAGGAPAITKGYLESGTVVTSSGRRLQADYIISCVGQRANTGFIAASCAAVAAAMTPAKRVTVDASCRVVSAAAAGLTLFALGDCAEHPSGDPAVAHTAEKQAAIVAHNVITAAAAAPGQQVVLAEYPRDYSGSAGPSPRIFLVSLGPSAALLCFDGWTVTDRIIGQRLAAAMKHVLEVTKVWQLSGWWVGELFWMFGDAAAVWTSAALRVLSAATACCARGSGRSHQA